ncbi:IclR family transcriptional regulator [Novosphingobium malaysiense]|uniref:IclR family transcriptional regulator n=1 Tax=Novosphingobium malaysiense TaxID=1348853 RepID=A0A0B1ZD48_9SPHN|nr:helix-turn-helix domain-containing protein [Novosphingobium malaysiense]KHK88979.1 hypothetical protein LK12_23105 [Novosphingobium malaysiense]
MSTVKSAQRTLEVLELMERSRRPLGVSQIARLLGYPHSSTSVLVNCLKDLGYLNFDPETREFAPSIRVALVGGYLRFGDFHASDVLNLLSSIQKATASTTILSSRNGVYAQYVYVLPAPGRGIEGLRAGSLRPLTRSAPGLVLMADCSLAEIGKIVRRINTLADATEHEVPAETFERVRDARKAGYAWVYGRLVKDIGSVAVSLPLHDSFGKAMAVSVAVPRDEIEDRHGELASIISSLIGKHLDR